MERLNLSEEDVLAYLRELRRRIRYLSRESFRVEEALRRLIPTEEKLLDRCELYPCHCGSFQQDIGSGCEACGGRITRGASPAVMKGIELETMLEKGVYLELGIGRLLSENGFETQIGKHVQGISGIDHEVDLLAYNRGGKFSLLVEVTRRAIDRRELADLILRRADVPANVFAIVSSSSVDAEVAKFASANRIALFPFVQKNPDRFVRWLDALKKERGTALAAT